MPDRNRRGLLRRIGATVTAGGLLGLAGCSETVRVEIGDADESTRTLRPTDQPTRTPSPTPTPTAVDTMTAAESATPSETASPTETTRELVARYPFDGTVRDVAGGHHLTGEEPTYVDGPQGSSAAVWDGSFAASSTLYAPTTDDALTFSFWMRDDETRSTWDDDLLWKLHSANSEQLGVYCTTAGEPFMFTAGQGDNNTMGLSDADVLDGRWHHLAFVYDQPLDRMALYVDGTQEFDVEYTDDVPGMEDTRLYFGNNGPDGFKGYDGGLDDFRYYNESLTESEIRALYELGDSDAATPTATETPATTPTATETPTTTQTETATPTSTPSESSNGLVARYRFEGTLSDTTGQYDLSGTEPSYVAGPEGETASAWSGNFVSSGSGFYAPDPGDDLSVSFWLRDDGTESRWDDDLLWKITSEGGDQFGAFCDTDGELFVFSSGDNTVGESTTPVLDGQWHHAAFVYKQAADRITYYLDGDAEYSIGYTDDLTGMQTTALFFGNNGTDGWKEYDGGLDDFRLYNRALTSEEVSRIASE